MTVTVLEAVVLTGAVERVVGRVAAKVTSWVGSGLAVKESTGVGSGATAKETAGVESGVAVDVVPLPLTLANPVLSSTTRKICCSAGGSGGKVASVWAGASGSVAQGCGSNTLQQQLNLFCPQGILVPL